MRRESILSAALAAALITTIGLHAASAATYYVAPDGSDHAAGTLDHPFASISRAQKAAEPGDTVYLRGGTYHITEKQIDKKVRIWAYVFDMEKSGREGAPIRYQAYKTERPVFDFSAIKPAGLRVTAFYVGASWLVFKGFDVTGLQVTIKTHTQSECFENQGSHNLYENLAMHDGMGIGFYLLDGSDNLILNCDAYRNWDPVSENGRGGNVDGFGCHPRKGAVHNVFRGCRAWFNSDDGYDCIHASETVTFDHCWAFYNGFSTQFKSLGDGNGFKAGGYARTPADRLPNPIPHHIVRFCVAARNKAHGFYANHHMTGNEWLNNSAYKNGVDFDMVERVGDDLNVPGTGQVLKNNLAYKGRKLLGDINLARCTLVHNSFDLKLTDADFQSLDEKQLMRPRGKDGALPEITFLHPVKGTPIATMGAFVHDPKEKD